MGPKLTLKGVVTDVAPVHSDVQRGDGSFIENPVAPVRVKAEMETHESGHPAPLLTFFATVPIKGASSPIVERHQPKGKLPFEIGDHIIVTVEAS